MSARLDPAEVGLAVAEDVDIDACLLCGCTNEEACFDGCAWVADRICSACLENGAITAAIEILRRLYHGDNDGHLVFDDETRAALNLVFSPN